MHAQPTNEADVFWGELTPCDHAVQIYEDAGFFVESLVSFVGGGLRAGEAVVVIATSEHLNALEDRLQADGINLNAARARDQYLPASAEETLSKFLVDGWPDEELFERVVYGVLNRARKNGRPVRAFGEMVALMWQQGHQGGTVRLEHFWHRLCKKEDFTLFCAYPRSGFTDDAEVSIKQICEAHSRVLSGRRPSRVSAEAVA